MCKQPFTIPNPLRNSAQVSVGRFTPNVNNPYIQLYKDTTAQYIAVPCGHCAECRRLKQLGLITRVKFESLVNYVYFFTLTYNSNIPYISIPGFDENFYYADYSDVQKMFKRIRKNNLIGRPFKYLVVREYGKKGRPHFHGLLFVQSLPSDDKLFKFSLETKLYKLILDNWQRNEGSNRNPDYVNLTTYRYVYRFGRANYNYDLHLVQPDDRGKDDACGFYVIKYMFKKSKYVDYLYMKLLNQFPDKDEKFRHYWNYIKPKSWKSVDFGRKKDDEVRQKIISDARRSLASKLSVPNVFFEGQNMLLPKFYYPVIPVELLMKFREGIIEKYGTIFFEHKFDYRDFITIEKNERSLDYVSTKVDVFDLFDDEDF